MLPVLMRLMDVTTPVELVEVPCKPKLFADPCPTSVALTKDWPAMVAFKKLPGADAGATVNPLAGTVNLPLVTDLAAPPWGGTGGAVNSKVPLIWLLLMLVMVTVPAAPLYGVLHVPVGDVVVIVPVPPAFVP